MGVFEESKPSRREFAQQLLYALRSRAGFGPELFRRVIVAPFDSVDSTMNVVHSLRDDELFREQVGYRVVESISSDGEDSVAVPIIALSREQRAGRGRMNRVWLSKPESGLYVTYLFETEQSIESFVGFSLAVGVATLRTAATFGVSAKLKWPNDLWSVDLKEEPLGKLAGILIESKVSSDRRARIAVGIGFNLLPIDEELPYKRSSLSEFTSSEISYADAFSALTVEIFRVWHEFAQTGLSPFLKEWETASLLTGRKVSGIFRGETITGIAVGIDQSGGLIVKQVDGTEITLLSHEVTIASFS